ncbi:MAG TPA: hypothetical protein VFE03_09925, partial [Caulobacteraceae bacterium]|nr:hypothetical protein [Caulobacteraceae bacterium]
EHDQTRRSLARVAGLALMVWGIGWAVIWALAAVGLFAFAIWSAMNGGGSVFYLMAAGAVIGGLVLVAFGIGKAMAGWILVKKDEAL